MKIITAVPEAVRPGSNQQTSHTKPHPNPTTSSCSSEAHEEGQVHGAGDAELIQVQRGGDEGQLHREEVAGVHQELAWSLCLLLLQSVLWGYGHQRGSGQEPRPPSPTSTASFPTSTLLMKAGLTRSSSPAVGVYARRIFTTWGRQQMMELRDHLCPSTGVPRLPDHCIQPRPHTCCGVSTVHRLQMAAASSSVAFFTCSS